MIVKNMMAATLLMATAVSLHTATPDPLEHADGYSLELSSDYRPTGGFFPLSILRNPGFEVIGPLGFTFSDGGGHCCYEFREGKPCTYKFTPSGRGPYFASLWSAHSLYQSRKTKNYGELKNSVADNGTPHRKHDLNLHDPATRRYVLDTERNTVKTILERGGNQFFMWGIDNEWECQLDYSPEAKTAFRCWLEKIYQGKISDLNQGWESKYQSFEQAEPPVMADFRNRPGAWLDWRRFQEETYTDFIAERFKTINDTDPLKRPVISKSTQCTLEMTAVAKKKANNHEMLAAKTRALSKGWYGIDMYGHDDRNCYEFDYLYNCIRPDNPVDRQVRCGLYAAEANNHAGPGWQFAESYWRVLANGIKGINFFTLGFFGAKDDWATFAMTDPADGSRNSRFYYAGRLASAIHRSEKFWADCTPAANVPRIAMLVPQRDIILAENNGVSMWDYPKNNRLAVYTRLRDCGYWVETIPYGKLNSSFLKRYQALVLINAEHLSACEAAAITEFVDNGGILMADNRAGFFDEHHRIVKALDNVLGVDLGDIYTGIDLSPDDLWYRTSDNENIRTDGKIKAKMLTATLLNRNEVEKNAKAAMVTCNRYGKGRAYWFNTRLGVLRMENAPELVASLWLSGFLEQAGIKPACRIEGNAAATAMFRVEQPMVDEQGNCALIVSNTVRQPRPATTLDVVLPDGKYGSAFWAPAESAALQPLPFRKHNNGYYRLELPEVRTAGIVYLFPHHSPLIGLEIPGVNAHPAADPWTAELRPGSTFTVRVQVVNPSLADAPAGTLSLKGYNDWKVDPQTIAVPVLKPGSLNTYDFRMTIPVESSKFATNTLYPLTARWNCNGRDLALDHTTVALRLDSTRYRYLLTDNPSSLETPRLFSLATGCEYRYLLPKEAAFSDPATAKENGKHGNALTAGLKWDSRQAMFDRIPEVGILFDLKAEYRLATIRIACGTPAWPTGFRVSISKDGKTFLPIAKTAINKTGKDEWFETSLNNQCARYVRLDVQFPSGRKGYLDEVEISGSPLKP